VADSFNYDGYGVMLSDNSRAAADAPTHLLYAGEQYCKRQSKNVARAGAE